MEKSQLLKIAKQLEDISGLLIEDCMRPEVALQSEPKSEPKAEAKPLTLDDLRVLAKTRIDKDGNMDIVKAALAELKADKLSALTKDQYSTFAKLLEA